MDGFITAMLLAALSGALVFAVTEAPGATPKPSDGVSTPEAVLAALWFLLVVGLWIGSHEVESLQRCTTTSVVLDAAAVERTTDGDGSLVTTKETTPAGTTSSECAPVGAAEMAVLLVPSVVLLRKGLKGFTFGPFGMDLREAQQAATKATTTYVLVRDNQGAEDMRAGQVFAPPDA